MYSLNCTNGVLKPPKTVFARKANKKIFPLQLNYASFKKELQLLPSIRVSPIRSYAAFFRPSPDSKVSIESSHRGLSSVEEVLSALEVQYMRTSTEINCEKLNCAHNIVQKVSRLL